MWEDEERVPVCIHCHLNIKLLCFWMLISASLHPSNRATQHTSQAVSITPITQPAQLLAASTVPPSVQGSLVSKWGGEVWQVCSSIVPVGWQTFLSRFHEDFRFDLKLWLQWQLGTYAAIRYVNTTVCLDGLFWEERIGKGSMSPKPEWLAEGGQEMTLPAKQELKWSDQKADSE